MKSYTISLITAAFATALPFTLSAQTTTTETTKTTTSSGSVQTIAPDTFTVRTESSTTPLSYTYSKTTKFVDASGAPVTMDVVKSGAPVEVHYIKEGDAMVAQRVVVRKSTTTTTEPGAPVTETRKKTTTTTGPAGTATETRTKTTTSSGTFGSLDGEVLTVRSTTEGAAPIKYGFTKTTQYVDEAGNAVSIDVVKSGAPVEVHYITEGDRQMAQKVVVKKTTTTVR